MKMDLPVLLIALALSAAVQNLLPGMPGSPLKIPFLSAVAIYCALNRPLVPAMTVAIWAGWLTDSAGGLPNSCTATFLLLLTLAQRPLRRMLLDGAFPGVVVAATVMAPLQALWQLAWARLAMPDNGWRAVGDVALLLPAGGVAGAAAFALFRTLDRWAGNVKRTESVHGVY